MKKVISGFPVIGIIDIYKTQTKLLQKIRKELGDKAVIKVVTKSILKHALEELDDGKMKQIENYIQNQPAIVLTNIDPFKFYILVKNLKFRTFAKKGDVAKEDIWAYAGPTSLLAGPAISEFQQAGLPASVEAGKIAIRKDTLFVKTGEEIDSKKANILRKLNIEPIEVTLNVVTIYGAGSIYGKDTLDLALAYPSMLPVAFSHALNLSVSVCLPTKENIKHLLMKAVRVAKGLSGVTSKPASSVPSAAAVKTVTQPEADKSGGVS